MRIQFRICLLSTPVPPSGFFLEVSQINFTRICGLFHTCYTLLTTTIKHKVLCTNYEDFHCPFLSTMTMQFPFPDFLPLIRISSSSTRNRSFSIGLSNEPLTMQFLLDATTSAFKDIPGTVNRYVAICSDRYCKL